MKTCNIVFASLFLFIACNNKSSSAKAKKELNSQDSLMAIAENFITAYNHHDLIQLRSLYTNEATITTVDFEGPKSIDSAIQITYGDYFGGTPDLKAVVRKIVVNANNIVIAFACRGTIRNIDKGDPALLKFKQANMKGKEINVDVVSMFQVKNGKIVEEKTLYDQIAFLKQIGAMK